MGIKSLKGVGFEVLAKRFRVDGTIVCIRRVIVDLWHRTVPMNALNFP